MQVDGALDFSTTPHDNLRFLASSAKELFNQDKAVFKPVVPYVQRYSSLHFIIFSGQTGIGTPHDKPFLFASSTYIDALGVLFQDLFSAARLHN